MHWSAGLLWMLLAQGEPARDSEQMQRWLDIYATSARDYTLFLEGPDGTPLQFHPQSLLNFSNPERSRGQHGSVFVWTHEGRPEAIGTIWSIRNASDPAKRRTTHEFQSLSLAPLHSQRRDIIGLGRKGTMPQWRPQSPGIALRAFGSAPKPASSQSARLVQMRQLARRFEAVCLSGDGAADPLRLLDQPLMRYESELSGVVDGGLFAMVMGTDPELLLVIELRDVGGESNCQYAAARFTGKPLELREGNELIWQCERAQPWVGNRPYFLCVGVEQYEAP